jgi:dienelactone hydrolase
MEGDGLVGSCGAAKTAPSGLSAAVTRSAEKGSATVAPGCNGPEVDTGGSVEAGVAAVVVVEEPGDAGVAVVDVPGRGEVGVGGPELQAARSSGAATAVTNPNCTCRPGFPRIGDSMAGTAGRYGAPMAITRDISYESDGRTMIGTLALPDGSDQRPGVLVCHEGPGLDDHARSRAVRLADELGYVAFALDYHGDGKPITDREQMMARIMELRADPPRIWAVGTAGLDILRAEPRTDSDRLAAIGYCFGGTLSLELARGGADLKAVVGFHSGLSTVHPEDARNITGKVLACIGADDPMVNTDERRAFEEEMRGGGVDWQLNVYGGAVHSFTNERASMVDIPGIAYDEVTDRRSWQAMLDLFAEVF